MGARRSSAGSIDAWVVCDPFLAAVERQANARVLSDGTNVAQYQRYYLASESFSKARPDVHGQIGDRIRAALTLLMQP